MVTPNEDLTISFSVNLKDTLRYTCYVDDLMITSSNTKSVYELKNIMKLHIKLKYVIEMRDILGWEVSRYNERIILNQTKYSLEFLVDTGLLDGRSSHTSMEQNIKLNTPEYDKLFSRSSYCVVVDIEHYWRIVRKLLYLTMTGLRITYQFQHLI